MNYSIGDMVVCIDATDVENLKCGAQYRVAYLTEKCVGLEGLILPERLEPGEVFDCDDCGESDDPYMHFDPWRFVKLDGVLQDAGRTETRIEEVVIAA